MDVSVINGEVTELVNVEHSAESVREQAHRHLQKYIAGAWRDVGLNEFHISIISGGLCNYLYKCSLPCTASAHHREPTEVLYRIHGMCNDVETLAKENVIYAILAERQFGPKIYGVIPGARFEEILPGRSLEYDELSDTLISSLVAHKIARLHDIVMPVNKHPTFLYELTEKWIDEIYNKIIFDTSCHQKKLQRIMKFNLYKEWQYMKSLLLSACSSIVFSHNDIQEGNILLLNPNTKTTDVMIIDYEFCAYNYRCFDIANHFCEWTLSYKNKSPPYFSTHFDNFPTWDQQMYFIKEYLNETERLSSEPFTNEKRSELESEISSDLPRFVLMSHFLWAVWAVIMSKTLGTIGFDYLAYSITRLEHYTVLKRKFKL